MLSMSQFGVTFIYLRNIWLPLISEKSWIVLPALEGFAQESFLRLANPSRAADLRILTLCPAVLERPLQCWPLLELAENANYV